MLRMALSVPTGSEAEEVGTMVTRVRPLKDFVGHSVCGAVRLHPAVSL